MPTYYDASFLLAGLLEPDQPDHHALWDDEPVRFGSTLLEAECVTVLRRVAAANQKSGSVELLSARLECLERYLASIHIECVDHEILCRLREEPRLSNCRTLDALHLATALLLQDQVDEPLTICTLDNRMRTTAQTLGFSVKP